MVKTYKCPGCGGALEYDPLDERMHCAYCGSSYAPEEVSRMAVKEEGPEVTRAELDEARKRPTISMNIAVCNSCGAELAVNDVEVSSFCPYCGNAAVVMDRVEERLAPDYIIPFKVGSEQAEAIIRAKLSGFFVPNAIKHFEVERLRGIYIPFWLYDVYFSADQKWQYSVSEGRNSKTYYAHMIGECNYKKMTVDASKRFEDASSQRLEPYYMKDLQKFDAAYLSGFYSDRFDVGERESDRVALDRSWELYDESMKLEVQDLKAGLVSTKPRMKVLKKDYALLPVWFLTFNHDKQKYTFLVNGQTKKMVGAVPVSKIKAILTFVILSVLFCFPLRALGGVLMDYQGYKDKHNIRSNDDPIGSILVFWVVATIFIWYWALKKYFAYRKSVELSQSSVHDTLAKERQDRV
ncbi:MAG: hypothetical protein IKX10_00755 [Lachnospiraceae bacterium]|nr:hypothetical protein [Lachnospiraceae bacterium]